MATDADVDLSAVLMQVFGNLKTRGAASHNQNGAGRQFAGIAVLARMQLADVVRHIGTESWNDSPFRRWPMAITTLLASMAPSFVHSK